ncbi:Hsp20/alpha crystallin family protein [Paenibacillus sp. GYB003]|uniref:Hsp20/alpha crystallin family protein n=1 Tax=Paenibacillus sp. GYB003 TaxID=2994392 RepID=UPI002F969F43
MGENDGRQAGNGADGPMFDWEQFQNGFFGGPGWKEALSGAAGTIPWVDRYVKNILAETVPAAVAHQAGTAGPPPSAGKLSSIACNVFETHRAIFVRIRLNADVDPRSVRLFAFPGELKVAGLPGEEDKTVKFPALVRVDGAKAIYKRRIVEVTLPKEEEAPAKEIPIRYMEGG